MTAVSIELGKLSRNQELGRWDVERAFDADVFLGGFELEDAEVCEAYKAEFDEAYRANR